MSVSIFMMIGQMHNKEELVKLLELHLDHPLVRQE